MELNKKQTLKKNRILKIESAVQEAIDKICQEENFDVSYAEINSALIKIMKSNNEFELKNETDSD
jgi:hypothetical protein